MEEPQHFFGGTVIAWETGDSFTYLTPEEIKERKKNKGSAQSSLIKEPEAEQELIPEIYLDDLPF